MEKQLGEQFPHLQGNKSAWEVRLLKSKSGHYDALLDDPDFSNQHTDSHSTGMIEVTQSEDDIVKDLRDWEPKKGTIDQFSRDVIDGELHYYFSDLHHTTKRFKDGMNPPIVSAIRYLTKAFQYELDIGEEDLKKIKKIIDDFEIKDVTNSYVKFWLTKNGKKLIQHATDIEYAMETLEKLGLKQSSVDLEIQITLIH